jgi:hypothetical protein
MNPPAQMPYKLRMHLSELANADSKKMRLISPINSPISILDQADSKFDANIKEASAWFKTHLQAQQG